MVWKNRTNRGTHRMSMTKEKDNDVVGKESGDGEDNNKEDWRYQAGLNLAAYVGFSVGWAQKVLHETLMIPSIHI